VNGRLSIIVELDPSAEFEIDPSYAISLIPFILLNVCYLVESIIFETGSYSQRSF